MRPGNPTKLEGGICPFCGLGYMHEETIKDIITHRARNGEVRQLEVEARYYICSSCGDGVPVSREEQKRLNRIEIGFRRECEGLLSSEEIKEIRKKLGLTQEQIAELLDVGRKNFARYEADISIQSPIVDKILRLLQEHPDNLETLRRIKGMAATDEHEGEKPFARILKQIGKRRFSASGRSVGRMKISYYFDVEARDAHLDNAELGARYEYDNSSPSAMAA